MSEGSSSASLVGGRMAARVRCRPRLGLASACDKEEPRKETRKGAVQRELKIGPVC